MSVRPPYVQRPETRKLMQAILEYIIDYRGEHGYSPAYREIANKFHMTISTTHYHISRMESAGMLRLRAEGISRSLVPNQEA